MIEIEKKIEKLLIDIIDRDFNIKLDLVNLELPPKKDLWDFSFWCFVLSKELKKNPNEIANILSNILENELLIEKTGVVWPYLNLTINKTIYRDIFSDLFFSKKDIIKNNKTIVIDYIWANVWKPLHIWHMCTPNQWQVMINVYRVLWYNVISDSHIWDWWIIFWKLITAYKKWWDKNKLEEDAVNYLLELYIKITSETEVIWEELENEIRNEFKKLSLWEKESVELWSMFTKYSILSMNKQLERLNVKPDFNIWESFYEGLWLPKMGDYPDLEFDMKSIVFELLDKNIATKNEDWSVWIIFEEKTKIPSCILQKRDWTHWYLASDLAAVKYRVTNWNPDKIIYFVDSRQQLHLKQVFEVSRKAWWINQTELFHAYNGFISLKDWAMSTRKWRIIKLDSLLNEAEKRAEKIILEKRDDISWDELVKLSKIIWIWAIKYWYLKKSRETDVIFDWDEFMTFDGNSWPYIQYAYVRAIRILEKSWISFEEKTSANFSSNEEVELLKSILNFESILIKSTHNNTPHVICEYTYKLTKVFSSFYNNIHILSEEDIDTKILRLQLVSKFAETIKKSFSILWIDMPEKM